MKKYFLITLLFLICFLSANKSFAKETDSIAYKISEDDEILVMIDGMLSSSYYNAFGFCLDTLGNLPKDSVPVFADSIYEQRLKLIDQTTPFDLRYNQYTKAFINLYVNKKRKLSSSVLRLAPLYFPLFEEVLDRFDIPLELKYLAVVESALNPSARSRAGAVGLWQFMYRTGKMYDLKVTSYYDERMDPYQSTVAACRYMKQLYGLYGDWSLVLAAYNSGPGNVNKAIRRSGGQKDYWKIRAWLPRETRGYVPAFIAVNYMMNYAQAHNLYAESNQLFSYEVDTVEIKRAMNFKEISRYINVSEEELSFYNPMYKLGYIPDYLKQKTLCLPIDQVGLFLINEKSIYADMERLEKMDTIKGKEKKEVEIPEMFFHRVRSGEFLGYIANKYRVSVRDLMAWNNLRSSRLNPGDRLKVYAKPQNKPSQQPLVNKTKTEEKSNDAYHGKYQIHIVRSGDTLWDIAKEYSNTSVNDLKRLNSNINFRRLKPGMQLKVKQIG